ncbi:hypothetical protein AC578_289 [Pseudocercospora eumusae]|uniref:Alkaline ceramidase n=1 Tax=Pseudocercospora eumusae TaxID=321146 RepID=A0A139H6Y1_9PEZI|nr:hypothetical protein AC578_289 [Pseudocercospora eumusae]
METSSEQLVAAKKLWDQSMVDHTKQGYWGAPTSHVNFCEQDYQITYYIAEFINTTTSLAYIAYGIHGLRRQKRRDASLFSTTNLAYWALIGVGIFSSLYHTTLKYQTQMSDEMSMYGAMGSCLLQVFTFKEPPSIQRRNVAIILGVIIPFIIYHCLTDEFILHVILFFALSITVSRRTRHIIKSEIRDEEQKRKLRFLIKIASCFGFGSFGIWIIDNLCCALLTSAKKAVGYPWSILLEFHGWWHIGTAISSYSFMALIEFLTNPEEGKTKSLGFAWPAKVVLQDLLPAGAAKSNGHVEPLMNGKGDRKSN